jgi:hypothetical protein
MNWEAIGVIAEVIGAFAVVFTLAFLTMETRRNRIATESAAVDALAAGWNFLNVEVMGDSELSEIWVKGFDNPESLSEAQLNRFMFMGQSYLNQFMTVKKHHDGGGVAGNGMG